MPRANKWRCGKRRNHESGHGDWVEVQKYKKEKWRCGEIAQSPPAKRKEGDRFGRFVCPWPECSYIHPDSGPARSHWYTHIYQNRLKVFTGKHGTEAGYYEHRRLAEEACAECRQAHSEHNNRKRKEWQVDFPRPKERPDGRRGYLFGYE